MKFVNFTLSKDSNNIVMRSQSNKENLNKTEKDLKGFNRPALKVLVCEQRPRIFINPQKVQVYSEEIFKNLEKFEERFVRKGNFLDLQREIDFKTRAFLVDWMIATHFKLGLVQETLFIAVGVVDRYLAKRIVVKKQVQLVGLAGLFIAAKYEEIYPPDLRNWLGAADGGFSKIQLVRMESDVLNAIDFQVTVPTAYRFLDKFADSPQTNRLFAEYLLELALVEYSMSKFKMSTQATAAMYLSGMIVSKTQKNKQDDLRDQLVKDCIIDFCKIAKISQMHPLTAVREKYIKKKLDISRYEKDFI